MRKVISTWIGNFRHRTDGNVATLFCIASLPLLAALGCAVDYSAASSSYAKMMGCADTAILAAVGSAGMTQSSSEAETSMLAWFASACPASGAAMSNVTIQSITAKATDTNNIRSASLTFQASRKNDFLNVVGFPNSAIKGLSQGTSATPTYIDIYSLLDISPSMGLASTTAEQARLRTLTPDTCEFACHVTGAKSDNLKIARANSVQLRVDVLRDSWKSLIQQAQQDSVLNIFRIATYTFDRNLNQEQALTSNLSAALSSANNIDLVAIPSSGPGSTYADDALASLSLNVPAGGDGLSQANSKKYVIFVTDGVQDIYNCAATWCHQIKTVTPLACQVLKSRSVSVAVIYTKYLPMSNSQYTTLVQPFENNIATDLQQCASTDLYFQAEQASDISNAFDAILSQIKSKARVSK